MHIRNIRHFCNSFLAEVLRVVKVADAVSIADSKWEED